MIKKKTFTLQATAYSCVGNGCRTSRREPPHSCAPLELLCTLKAILRRRCDKDFLMLGYKVNIVKKKLHFMFYIVRKS